MNENWIAPTNWTNGEITLRKYSIEDAEGLTVAVTESYEHLGPWMPWANPTQTVGQSKDICQRIIDAYNSGSDYTVVAMHGDTLIGGTGFHLRCGPIEWRCAEIGMWIRSSYSGAGWGTRVLELMLEWGFTDWGWERLVWKCDTKNVASARVAEKAGLTLEATQRSDALDVNGNRRDTHQYVILKPEWTKR
jgi:RimJ/RimL family protein N-acetyltransferase